MKKFIIRIKNSLKLFLVVLTLIFVSNSFIKAQIFDGGTLPEVTLRCWDTMRRSFSVSLGIDYFSVSVTLFDIVSYQCNNGYSGYYLDY